jgi:8-oxo-dGTP diphosphatase
VDDETSRDAAARELQEETGLIIPCAKLKQLPVFDSVERDTRGRVISVPYVTRLINTEAVAGADDAIDARWVGVDNALRSYTLAFDHAEIIKTGLSEIWYHNSYFL